MKPAKSVGKRGLNHLSLPAGFADFRLGLQFGLECGSEISLRGFGVSPNHTALQPGKLYSSDIFFRSELLGFFNFVHRPVFRKLENTTFRKLDMFPSSGEG
jgi:hypothetical protein